MNIITLRMLQGVLLSLGAPLGWLIIRLVEGSSISAELSSHWGLYSYMLFGTMAVFLIFGSYVGTKEHQITELAVRDSLTGIFNLRYFIDRLNEEISRTKRYDNPLALIYFDLDHFKHVNDTYGHPVGDKVLIKVVQTVRKNIRDHDIFARTGGEEFAILLSDTNESASMINAERIRAEIEAMTIRLDNDLSLKITVSIGVANWLSDESASGFYKRADEYLYKAKTSGRNCVVGKA